MRKNSSIQKIIYVALFAVFIAICAWISIPFIIPFTMQTFAVFLAFYVLGGKLGTISVLVYLTLGAIGIPVYSGFSCGVSVLFGMNGGYMLGWILAGGAVSLCDATSSESRALKVLSSALGLVLCYAVGTAWFMIVYASTTGEIGLVSAISWCVLPFVIPDAVKLTLAYVLSNRLRKIISPSLSKKRC